MQMNISIPPKMCELIQNKVKSGMYSNASDVIRDALRTLEQQQKEADSWTKLNLLLAEGEEWSFQF